ncbi:MAG TPA: hypothetical protein VGZ89_20600 [Xanthobacteraceae bacterium]|jgi:hypothetical protein|nr:hypothetical protein [Xanthobacteraceae bacterium]
MQVAGVPCDLVQSHFQGGMPHVQDQHDIIQKGAKRAQAEAKKGAPETGRTSCANLPRASQNNQCASESPHDHTDETKWKIPCGDEKETARHVQQIEGLERIELAPPRHFGIAEVKIPGRTKLRRSEHHA